ncbi:hypothetical protein GCM10029964_061710 [Kibdelosporangium lantanae]
MLTAIFFPALDMPVVEKKIHEGRKRIDIDYTNIATKGFFYWLHAVHGVSCSFVPVECKNYSQDIGNPEYDQLTSRFSIQTGSVGMLCYRKISNKSDVIAHCRDSARDGRGYIIALDDMDLTKMVNERKSVDGGDEFRYLFERFRDIVQ